MEVLGTTTLKKRFPKSDYKSSVNYNDSYEWENENEKIWLHPYFSGTLAEFLKIIYHLTQVFGNFHPPFLRKGVEGERGWKGSGVGKKIMANTARRWMYSCRALTKWNNLACTLVALRQRSSAPTRLYFNVSLILLLMLYH